MVCTKCGRKIIDKNENGTVKLRARILLFGPDGAKAVCPSCKTENAVPVALTAAKTPARHVVVH